MWFTGLPCAGKSTLAAQLARDLEAQGMEVALFDGDVVRKDVSADLGFSREHRHENALRVAAAARAVVERGAVAAGLADAETRERLRQVARPNSVSKTLRKAGVALILAPDPITAVPGAIMLGASFANRRRDPLSPSMVVEETQKLLSEMGSYF